MKVLRAYWILLVQSVAVAEQYVGAAAINTLEQEAGSRPNVAYFDVQESSNVVSLLTSVLKRNDEMEHRIAVLEQKAAKCQDRLFHFVNSERRLRRREAPTLIDSVDKEDENYLRTEKFQTFRKGLDAKLDELTKTTTLLKEKFQLIDTLQSDLSEFMEQSRGGMLSTKRRFKNLKTKLDGFASNSTGAAIDSDELKVIKDQMNKLSESVATNIDAIKYITQNITAARTSPSEGGEAPEVSLLVAAMSAITNKIQFIEDGFKALTESLTATKAQVNTNQEMLVSLSFKVGRLSGNLTSNGGAI